MTDRTAEIARIVKLYAKAERSYTYPGLPEAEHCVPLQKYPPQATLTERIGNTEYTVNAHFREEGRDLLYYLSQCILRGVKPNDYDESGNSG